MSCIMKRDVIFYYGRKKQRFFRLAISQLFYLLRVFLKIWDTFFQPVFCRISHDLICNKFAILKNRKLTQILGV